MSGSPAERIDARILLILLVVVTGAGRVAYLIHDRPYLQLEGAEMERAAANLAREGAIGRIYSNETGKSAHVSPLYPLLLAGLYRVFGWNTIAGRLAQELSAIAATTAGIALLPVVARKARLSPLAGWAAAFALAVLPLNLWVETSGCWEQPYSALALLGLFFIFSRLSDDRWRNGRLLVLGGGFLGLVALLSPSLLPAGALMAAAEFVSRREDRRRVAAGSLAMGLAAGLVVAPWTVRNYYALGGFVPLRSNFGLELAIGNNPQANGKGFIPTLDDPATSSHPIDNTAELARLQSMGELAYMRDRQRTALHWMTTHPAETLRLTLLRFRLYWFPGVDSWAPRSSVRGFKSMIFSLLGAAALLNLAYLAVIKHPRAWLLAAAVIGPSLIYMVTHVDLRYRYPTFGLSTLLAFDLAASACWIIAGRPRRAIGTTMAPLESPTS